MKKKKIVIEGVKWDMDDVKLVYPIGLIPGTDWPDLINKPPMTMTLEWEEQRRSYALL